MIIDAHHHFLDPARIDYPFLRFLPDLARPLGTEALAPLLREAGVDATVCVQAADALEETAFQLEQAARAEWVAGVVFLGGCDAARLQPYVDHALACFGPERLLWASNWPVSLQLRGYRELLDTARRVISSCSETERAAILGGNANRVYRLGL